MKISVIIPVYNALKYVKKLFKSLNKNFDFENNEIIIVNDFSDTKTTKFLENFVKKNKQYKLMINESNLGYIKSCNKGIEKANGDIIVLLNSDTQIPEQFCKKIVDCFKSDEKIGLASPISSSSVHFCIPLPFLWNANKMNKYLEKKHSAEYPLVPACEGFCLCIRKDVISKQGSLDEAYGKGYHEEIDYSFNAIKNGWKNVLIDNLYVIHKQHESFGKEERFMYIKNNLPILKERWGNFGKQYTLENNIKNPIIKITKELFPKKIERKEER